MSVFKRGQQAVQTAVAPDPLDQPDVLRGKIKDLDRFINAHAGSLPGAAVVSARFITDMLAQVLDASEGRPLDVYALLSLKSILGDFLPTTLNAYLALDPSQVHVPRPSGKIPDISLLEQLESLRSAAEELLTAAREQDADALMTQGNFLQTKFTQSDLTL